MTETTHSDQVADSKAIKAERDRQAQEVEAQERADAAEAARIREVKIRAGLLGVCPGCGLEVATAEGTVLRHHLMPGFSGYATAVDRVCDGTGEEPLGIGERPGPRTIRVVVR